MPVAPRTRLPLALALAACLAAPAASAAAAVNAGGASPDVRPQAVGLSRGAHGAAVRALQRLLTQAGHRVAADGAFGPGTERALKAYERSAHLPADGVAGAKVLAALRRAARKGAALAQDPGTAPPPTASATLNADGTATAPADAPATIAAAIAAANEIASTPYVWGGGHARWDDRGYDCSGSVSYALHGAGLLDASEDSTGLMSYGDPGPGSWITIYANRDHAFMVVAGLRYDTSGADPSRWQADARSTRGFRVRHPAGY